MNVTSHLIPLVLCIGAGGILCALCLIYMRLGALIRAIERKDTE
jgi:hypothetical protein